MLRKLAALAGAGALLLAVAGPALAWGYGGGGSSGGLDIKNWASVVTNVYTKADTGDNTISGFKVSGGKIRTGDAVASSGVYTEANTTLLSGCEDCGSVKINNGASVQTTVTTKADTGDNTISGFKVSGGKIWTGGAEAGSLVNNVVNFTSVGVDL